MGQRIRITPVQAISGLMRHSCRVRFGTGYPAFLHSHKVVLAS